MNTDSPITLVWLESHSERSAWGLWIIDIDGSIHEAYGVSCHSERAALWLWLEILGPLRHGSDLILRSQQQKTLSLLDRLLEAAQQEDPSDPLHDLLSQIRELNVEPQITWMPVMGSPLEADVEIKKRTQAAIEDYSLSFPPEDIDYIMANLESFSESSEDSSEGQVQSEWDVQDGEDLESLPSDAASEDSESSIEAQSSENAELDDSPAVKTTPHPHEKARFVGYVEGVGNMYLGAWAFVLIDRESGHGLMRAEGVRLAPRSRMPLMAIIGLIESLKSSDQHIEICSRELGLLHQLQTEIPKKADSEWLQAAGLTIDDLPYLSALKSLIQKQMIDWSSVSEDCSNPPMTWALELAFESLGALNTGESHQFEKRFKLDAIDWD